MFLSTSKFKLLIFLVFTYGVQAQVGIGNTNPRTALDVDGGVSIRTGGNIVLTNANNNDVNLGVDPHSFYRITGPTAAFNISSIASISGAATDGQIVTFENTTTHSMRIRHNNGGTNINRILCPRNQDLYLNGQYSTVTLMYETTDNRWIVIGYTEADNSVESVSLSTDFQISSNTWTNVPGMTLTFTAGNTSTFVMFSASGFAFTSAMAYVSFRVRNGAVSMGGTNTKMQSYDDVTGTITLWNCSFTKLLTGLTIGNTYTLTVQALVDGIYGTYNAAIFTASNPDSHHITLSILH